MALGSFQATKKRKRKKELPARLLDCVTTDRQNETGDRLNWLKRPNLVLVRFFTVYDDDDVEKGGRGNLLLVLFFIICIVAVVVVGRFVGSIYDDDTHRLLLLLFHFIVL